MILGFFRIWSYQFVKKGYDSSFQNYTSTVLETDSIMDYDLVEQILASCFCLFALIGIVSNLALLLIYKKKDLSIRFNCLMLLLATFDMVTMFMYLLTLILAVLIGPDKLDILLYFDSCCISCSVYTITAIALERFLVLCKQV